MKSAQPDDQRKTPPKNCWNSDGFGLRLVEAGAPSEKNLAKKRYTLVPLSKISSKLMYMQAVRDTPIAHVAGWGVRVRVVMRDVGRRRLL